MENPVRFRFGVSQCLWGAMRTALKCNNNNHPPTHTASEKVRCWAVGLLDAAGSSSADVTHQPAAEGASTRLGKPFIAITAELFFCSHFSHYHVAHSRGGGFARGGKYFLSIVVCFTLFGLGFFFGMRWYVAQKRIIPWANVVCGALYCLSENTAVTSNEFPYGKIERTRFNGD